MKRRTLTFLVASMATLSMMGSAMAYVPPPIPQSSTFEVQDANKDGVLSFDEVLGIYPTLPNVFFNQADSNNDGVLDESEYAALEGLTAAFDTTPAARPPI